MPRPRSGQRRDCGALLGVSSGMSRVASKIVDVFDQDAADAARKFAYRGEKSARHVLVVDDEPLIRWSATETLAQLGIVVEDAPDAASALKMVTTAAMPFDAVVLDLRLPDMYDLSLLATLRQLLPDARLILMTAFGTPETAAGVRELGAELLAKPFKLEELNRLVLGHQRDPH